MSVFAPVGSSNTSTTIVGSNTPTIANVSVPVANTQVSYVLPTNTKQYMIKVRPVSAAVLQVAYVSGQTNTNYITIPPKCFYSESELSLGGLTIYFESDLAGQTVEIVSWV